MFKKPLTLNEQLDHLKANKRVVFNDGAVDEEIAAEYLLRYNYINLISPFKHDFHKGKNQFGKHVYDEDIEFSEYLKRFNKDMNKCKNLRERILDFEMQFNAILCYCLFIKYKQDNRLEIKQMIDDFRSNARKLLNKSSYYMETINNIEKDIFVNDLSPYIAFDRLSIGKLAHVFNVSDEEVKNEVFEILKKFKFQFATTNIKDFENVLFYIVGLRNTVAHNNSLTIFIRFHNIKYSQRRTRSNEKYIRELIERILR